MKPFQTAAQIQSPPRPPSGSLVTRFGWVPELLGRHQSAPADRHRLDPRSAPAALRPSPADRSAPIVMIAGDP
jgi:hypothetical protein